MNWPLKISEIENCLKRLSAFNCNRTGILPIEEAFGQWIEMAIRIRNERRTVFLSGNGASASMASHVADDLAKNGHVHTEVFSIYR
jgi:D-sedoheptulose 7-phosphate isomerase